MPSFAPWSRELSDSISSKTQSIVLIFRIPGFDFGLLVQNHAQQGIMDLDLSVIFDQTQIAKFVHEKAHARSGGSYHLRQHFLAILSHDRLRFAFLAEI